MKAAKNYTKTTEKQQKQVPTTFKVIENGAARIDSTGVSDIRKFID